MTIMQILEYYLFSEKFVLFLCILFSYIFLVIHYFQLRNVSYNNFVNLTDRIKKLGHEKMLLKADIELEKRKLAETVQKENNERLENIRLKTKIEELEREMASIMTSQVPNKPTLIVNTDNCKENIKNTLEAAAYGIKKMTESNWNILQDFINSQYPSMNLLISLQSEKLSIEQLHVCWLMRLGLSNTQIQNITDIPKTTVWRWTRKFEWIKDDKYRPNIATTQSGTIYISKSKNEVTDGIATLC